MLNFYNCCSDVLCDCYSNYDAAAVEVALFDGAVHCNDVCRGNKLIAWTVETLLIIIGMAE